MRQLIIIFMVAFLSFNLQRCAGVGQLLDVMGVKEPTARVAGVRVSGVTFENIDLIFDVEINNPNSMGVQMAAFDYRVIVNNQDLLQGNQQNSLRIEKNAKSSLPIPVKLIFADLYNLVAGLRSQDSTMYQFDCGLTFDLPVLGAVRIPVSTSGQVPLLKLPVFSLKNIRVNKFGIGGADILFNVGVKNPNALLLRLNEFAYNFDVSGFNWAKGTSRNLQEVSPGGETTIQFPVSLNFLEMGRNIFALLSGSSNLDYEFTGGVNIGTSWSLLNNIQIDINESGTVPVLK